MANSGYAAAGLADGFVRGFSLMEAADQRRKDNEFRNFQRGLMEQQNTRQQQAHDSQLKTNELNQQLSQFKIDEAEWNQLSTELNVDLRRMEKTGEPIDFNKYKRLGLDKLATPESRQQMMASGKAIKDAIDKGQVTEEAQLVLRDQIQPEMERRTAIDGIKREFIGISLKKDEKGNDVYVPMLLATYPDGTQKEVPLTYENKDTVGEDGKPDFTGSKDAVFVFDEEKLEGFAAAMQGQAMLAEMFEKSLPLGADVTAQTIREIFFGKPKQEGKFSVAQGYNEQGQKQAYIYDEKTGSHRPIGGGSGSGSGSDRRSGSIDTKDYLKDLQAIRVSDKTEEEKQLDREQLANDYAISFGVHPDTVLEAQEFYRNLGINSPLTYEALAVYQAEKDKGLAAYNAENPQNEMLAGGSQEPEREPEQPALYGETDEQVARLDSLSDDDIRKTISAVTDENYPSGFGGRPISISNRIKTEKQKIKTSIDKSEMTPQQKKSYMAKIDTKLRQFEKSYNAEKEFNELSKKLQEAEQQRIAAIRNSDLVAQARAEVDIENLTKKQSSASKQLAELEAGFNQQDTIAGF